MTKHIFRYSMDPCRNSCFVVLSIQAWSRQLGMVIFCLFFLVFGGGCTYYDTRLTRPVHIKSNPSGMIVAVWRESVTTSLHPVVVGGWSNGNYSSMTGMISTSQTHAGYQIMGGTPVLINDLTASSGPSSHIRLSLGDKWIVVSPIGGQKDLFVDITADIVKVTNCKVVDTNVGRLNWE